MNQEAQDLGDYKDSLIETMGIQSYVERMIDDALDGYEPPTPDLDWIEIFNDVWERSCVRVKVLSFLQTDDYTEYDDFDEDSSRIARLENWIRLTSQSKMYPDDEDCSALQVRLDRLERLANVDQPSHDRHSL